MERTSVNCETSCVDNGGLVEIRIVMDKASCSACCVSGYVCVFTET